MREEDLLLHAKLLPPRQRRQVLPRPTLLQKLHDALEYRLTIVQAGTGYGKTTALAALDTGAFPLFWYSAEEADADPQRFLSYLIAAFHTRLPAMSDLPSAVLADRSGEGVYEAWVQTLDTLINALIKALPGPGLLIIDDYHFLDSSPEINTLTERLLTFLPSNLHVIIASRHPLAFPSLARWRTQGDVQEIGDVTLAFRPAEIEALFRIVYGMHLAPPEIASLAEKTDGWPIALQMVWQDLRNDSSRSARNLLMTSHGSLTALFDYLAREVLARQPVEVATFLQDTAVLRKLTPASSAVVTTIPNTADMLERLHHLDLFVVALGDGQYRYHHLFHDFLRQQRANAAETQERHRGAARFFEARHDLEEAIYHWLARQDFVAAAALIARAGEAALLSGRIDTVAAWIDALPPGVLDANPLLQVYRGDVFRLRIDFDKALAWYAQAEQTCRACGDKAGISRALRGRASIYLDIVQPAEGEHVLQEALLLIDSTADREAQARLLELVAENKLNMGEPDRAASLLAEARALREEAPDENVVSVRVKFRTGRLTEARNILEAWVAAEREGVALEPSRPPRAHRENLLLLSITYSFLGQAEHAIATAQGGIALGERLRSPFIIAVGQTRLGHAWQLQRPPAGPPDQHDTADKAISHFRAALAVTDQLAVRRARVEAHWGLTRAYGFSGDIDAARRSAEEGISMARLDGDAWLAAMIELMLGASYVLAGRSADAVGLLSRTLITLRECGDTFGRAATRLWLGLAYLDLGQREHFITCVEALLGLCELHGYEFLFTDPSMLAPPDSHRLVPLLLEARARRCQPAYVARLLAALGLADIQLHPGYVLNVQTLGAFRVWRGTTEIEPTEWQRGKVRQLFQLLLTKRPGWLQRDEIIENLWPDRSPEAAIRDFKVALSVLKKVLVPNHTPEAPHPFIDREGAAYRLRPEADMWVDAQAFDKACEEGLRATPVLASLQKAFQLYNGTFLPDALYEDWASAERERLLTAYLRVANTLTDQGQYNQALDVCQAILACDPTWEHAYRLSMLAYARQGNRSLALRAYRRCISVLSEELGVEPSPETSAMYERITNFEHVE